MVSQTTFRRWRIGVATISLISFILTAATYIREKVFYGEIDLMWGDYAQIIVNVVFLFTTWYGAFGKPIGVPPLFRAFVMFALAVLLLYVNLRTIHLEVQYTVLEGFPAFECGYSDLCRVFWSCIFFSVFLGFFVLFDVALTLKVGPLEPAGDAPTVVNVVQPPPQGAHYPPQPYYAPQPGQMQQLQQQQQQQQYYQQPMQQQQYYQQPVQQQLNPDGSYKTDQFGQPSPYQAQAQPYSPQHSPLPQAQQHYPQ